ncbi:hypothetical protein BDW42DRAFT_197854 [Aspergillus taichungensis]|uniref:Uncharacterized protein n=1 Tax=Aspergillus taichungensis TaxID=482145 RepID=A0A2J5HEH6_9EURO|nr:hypothetical protein BDW42DRAFT_197854 [Aspergillus taichungensis]
MNINIHPRIYPLNPPKPLTPKSATTTTTKTTPLLHTLRTLFARSFTCPPNTSPCTSINRPSTCCGLDEICQLVDSEASTPAKPTTQADAAAQDETAIQPPVLRLLLRQLLTLTG